MKSETIKTVEFVRQVRDEHYTILQDKTRQERIEFYRRKALKVQKQIDLILKEEETLLHIEAA